MELRAGAVTAGVNLRHGGRLSSLSIDGLEILVGDTGEPLTWGSYPMAPWAGRIGDGRFTFRGTEYQLERTHPPHAIHGTVWLRPWEQVDESTITTSLGEDWPFAGDVRQRFWLGESSLRIDMMLDAAEPMPVVMGWHPWFRRTVRGAPGQVDLDAGFMLVRSADGLPTRTQVTPPPGPWDDCFGGLSRFPTVDWPGVLRLTVASTCPWWVVYTEHPDGLCVEPQTAPPNALSDGAAVLEAGERLRISMEWRWERAD